VLLRDEGRRPLVRVDIETDEVTPVVGGETSVGAYDVNAHGVIAALVSEPHVPGEVFAGRLGGELRRITSVNDSLMATLRLGAVEKTRFRSKDGTPVDAFIVKPPDFRPGVRYPTILWIHGGPTAQHDWGFDFTAQLFAANGYVVVLTNYRGSDGYGSAFAEAVFRRWDGKPLEDLLAAVDHAIAMGIADPDRLGVGGWSFEGDGCSGGAVRRVGGAGGRAWGLGRDPPSGGEATDRREVVPAALPRAAQSSATRTTTALITTAARAASAATA